MGRQKRTFICDVHIISRQWEQRRTRKDMNHTGTSVIEWKLSATNPRYQLSWCFPVKTLSEGGGPEGGAGPGPTGPGPGLAGELGPGELGSEGLRPFGEDAVRVGPEVAEESPTTLDTCGACGACVYFVDSVVFLGFEGFLGPGGVCDVDGVVGAVGEFTGVAPKAFGGHGHVIAVVGHGATGCRLACRLSCGRLGAHLGAHLEAYLGARPGDRFGGVSARFVPGGGDGGVVPVRVWLVG
eukprot:1335278-Amorphochlora_amoeboformis.AAC.1